MVFLSPGDARYEMLADQNDRGPRDGKFAIQNGNYAIPFMIEDQNKVTPRHTYWTRGDKIRYNKETGRGTGRGAGNKDNQCSANTNFTVNTMTRIRSFTCYIGQSTTGITITQGL